MKLEVRTHNCDIHYSWAGTHFHLHYVHVSALLQGRTSDHQGMKRAEGREKEVRKRGGGGADRERTQSNKGREKRREREGEVRENGRGIKEEVSNSPINIAL